MTDSLPDSLSSGSLPSFKKPPINEVVCGMRFHTPAKLRLPHIGFLWDKLRKDYPTIQHAPPIASAKGELQVDEATGLPLQRVWFINERDDQLVQFQFDRFYFNWRRRKDDYPRYSHVISNFEHLLNNVKALFSEFQLGELKPVEYELGYINHIPKGQGWNTTKDLRKVFSDFVWRQRSKRFLPGPVNLAWRTEFPLPDGKGNMAVSLKQAIRTEDKIPLIVLDLTARGLGEPKSMEAFREWFDTAREWIVRGFADLTTDEAQRVWEREQDA